MSSNTLPALPSDLPPIGKARLPATYEGAKVALAECTRLDECQDWADKAEALASYAKQAQDDELRKMADRIQARAIRRCGELLKRIASASGGDRGNAATGGRPPVGETRTQVARDAGLSDHQRKTALRVARIPDPEFEGAIEGDDPQTVTELAQRGIEAKPPSKLDQVRALREQAIERQERQPDPPISKAGAAYYAEQSARVAPDLPALEQVLRLLRRDPAQLADLPREKRVSLARTCLAWLNVTLDDLRGGNEP